jgi:hypothetical protein
VPITGTCGAGSCRLQLCCHPASTWRPSVRLRCYGRTVRCMRTCKILDKIQTIKFLLAIWSSEVNSAMQSQFELDEAVKIIRCGIQGCLRSTCGVRPCGVRVWLQKPDVIANAMISSYFPGKNSITHHVTKTRHNVKVYLGSNCQLTFPSRALSLQLQLTQFNNFHQNNIQIRRK